MFSKGPPPRIRTLPEAERTPHGMMAAWEDSDYEKMNEIRARVDDIVKDPKTAEGLKAWYRQLCKRPCFHDDYLDSFNEPGTHLLHTDGKGVEQITETGLVANGVTYEVDCIIYASGFEVGTEHKRRAGFDLTGRGGQTLSDHWRDGMKTLHGTHVHGFPNAFIVQPTQGANLISNVPHNLTESGQTIALTVRHTLDQGHQEVEVTDDAEATRAALESNGAPYTVNEVHTVSLAHEPGSLAAFTRSLAENAINLRSLYILAFSDDSCDVGYTTA